MKTTLTLLMTIMTVLTWADIDFDNLGDNTWVQQATGGQSPGRGGDVHWAMDTSGFAYMFGGCTYGNGAGGTHNADMYRYDLKTGVAARIGVCGNNGGWIGGCQAGHAYDITRNVVWYGNGFTGGCSSGSGGLMRFQCPNGPITRVNSTTHSHYLTYDPLNDKLYAPDDWELYVYNCQTNTWSQSSYPFGSMTPVAVPCCTDTKRGLFVTTLGGAYSSSDPSNHVLAMWFYNGATGEWHSQTPPTRPNFFKAELAYDARNDKYVYFGQSEDGCHSQVWAYDYDSNTWTRMAENGRAYDDANKASSTWPPGRHKHAWEYSPVYNAFFSWGGGQWIDDGACTDYGDGSQPIWVYRFAKDSVSTGSNDAGMIDDRFLDIRVFPNPFNPVTTIHITGPDVATIHESSLRSPGPTVWSDMSVRIYNVSGRCVADLSSQIQNSEFGTRNFKWDASSLPSGIYVARLMLGKTRIEKRLSLLK